MLRTGVLLHIFVNRVNKIMDIWSIVQMAFSGGVVAGSRERLSLLEYSFVTLLFHFFNPSDVIIRGIGRYFMS